MTRESPNRERCSDLCPINPVTAIQIKPVFSERDAAVKKRLSEEQSIDLLRRADACVPLKTLCRRHGLADRGIRGGERAAIEAAGEAMLDMEPLTVAIKG
ncbi:hypothetical protein [Paraburkholderia sediminicola]|uniref:hypothetical protein n=1 Tax=Paraburkholderia sediminicola TaxID=458836 RepID=UPI0038B758C3